MEDVRRKFVEETKEELLVLRTFCDCKTKIDIWNDRYIDWLEAKVKNLGLFDVSGSSNGFEKDLMKLINRYTEKGLKKNLLVAKMKYATRGCELS